MIVRYFYLSRLIRNFIRTIHNSRQHYTHFHASSNDSHSRNNSSSVHAFVNHTERDAIRSLCVKIFFDSVRIDENKKKKKCNTATSNVRAHVCKIARRLRKNTREFYFQCVRFHTPNQISDIF